MIKIEETILQKCTFDDECDFCNEPKEGTFCRSGDEPDDFYWICGKCFNDIAKRFPNLDNMRLVMKIDEMQQDLPVKSPF